MDNSKVLVGQNIFGKCLIANSDIAKDELIVEFDGDVLEVEKASLLPQANVNHAIQFEEHKWRDSNGVARNINHSCEPNCGMKGLFTLVAMRDIKKGEELLWDYDMSEDSDWRMECECGTPSCRKVIGSFAQLPDEVRQKYKGYISDWLVKKYGLEK
jgi:hypothetical protein